jgi:polyphosphate kinase
MSSLQIRLHTSIVAHRRLPSRVQRFLKLKKSPASVEGKSSVLILKNICNLLCIVLAPEL